MAGHCGAKTRAGGQCKAPAMKNGRCRVHGGSSTGPKTPDNANAAKPGSIYSKFLTDDERADYEGLTLGGVDHELRLTRIRLARALEAEHKAAGLPELDEVTENDGGGEYVARETRKSKVRDYNTLIDRLTARIESLERTRKTLEDEGGPGGQDVEGFEVVPYGDHPAE